MPDVTSDDKTPQELPPATINPPEPLTLWEYLIGLSARMTVLFGFYVLSIGPMYWHWQSGKFGNGSAVIAAFYEPLYRLANLDDPFHIGSTLGDWLNYYISLWA